MQLSYLGTQFVPGLPDYKRNQSQPCQVHFPLLANKTKDNDSWSKSMSFHGVNLGLMVQCLKEKYHLAVHECVVLVWREHGTSQYAM